VSVLVAGPGTADPQALADPVQTRLKARHEELVAALTGMMFGDHRAYLARMLNLIGYLDEDIAMLEGKIAACLEASRSPGRGRRRQVSSSSLIPPRYLHWPSTGS
jgi:hypothetical protein